MEGDLSLPRRHGTAPRARRAAVVLLLVLAGCGGGGGAPAPAAPSPPQAPPPLPVAGALPVLAIDTVGGAEILSRETYVDASARLLDATGAVLLDGASVQIRGRGNSTWNYPKKPYRLRFASRTELLGMPANRHWVLLANYLDKTLLRNELAFELSRQVGMAWTPRSEQVVLELNGEYVGIYQLTEHIRIDPARVAVDELTEADGLDPVAVTGGYLMEVDFWRGEDYCPDTFLGVPLCFANPETLLEPGWEAHKAYIDGYVYETESALVGPDAADPDLGYAAYLDVESAVNFYLVHELFKNVDSNFFSSVFLYKPRGGRIRFGPVWDFDLGAGNAQFFGAGPPTGWHTRSNFRGANWLTELFEDPAFEARVRTRWAELRAAGAIDELFEFLERRAAWLSEVQQRNFERWDILYTPLSAPGEGLSPVVGPWEAHVDALESWLRTRVEWFDSQLLP